MDDILLIDKPKGISSFDVIRVLRKKLGIRKMGHAGTLDPNASGLLIIGIGEGTKKLTSLIGLTKSYEADIVLGIKTDSGDITGKFIEEKSVPTLSFSEIEVAVQSMVGDHNLPVPIYSAVKKDGKPLYSYARSGEDVEIPFKNMKVLSARFLGAKDRALKVSFEVSSGSYIRTLAEELAKKMGTVGTLENLRRLSVGEYRIEDAKTLDDF